MQELSSYIDELNKLLKNDPRIILLNDNEKEMENNNEVILLVRKKEEKENIYNDLLKIYKEDSDEVNNARKELYISKKNLEEHPVVRKYLDSYQQVRILYEKINNILFGEYKVKACNL